MRAWLLLLCLLVSPLWAAPVHTVELTSSDYKIDRIYRSMMGPTSSQKVKLGKKPGELLWVIGYEAIVVDPKSGREISQEYMCHSNLDYQPDRYQKTLPSSPLDGRFFTLSQGQQKVDFPVGFGIPIRSGEELTLWTQALNLNQPELKRKVRFRIRIRYLRDSELEEPMTALVQLGMAGLKSVTGKEAHFGATKAHGPGCSVGRAAVENDVPYEDQHGQRFTGHWVVQPGREVNHTNITSYLNLSEKLKVHYVAIHLHPYAESLELRDLTSKTTVFKGKVKAARGRVGIEHIDHYSSRQGFTLHPDHEYSLISVYNNTSGQPVDSMAVMYLYAAVPNFKPTP